MNIDHLSPTGQAMKDRTPFSWINTHEVQIDALCISQWRFRETWPKA